MNAAAFQRAVLRGAGSSPFKGDVTLIYGTTRHEVKDCVVKSGDNKAQADEFGLTHARTLDVHVLKTKLPRKPTVDKDAIEYLGRAYHLDSVEGDDACSPFWVIAASAPV